MRIFLGFLVAACALAAAVYLHEWHQVSYYGGPFPDSPSGSISRQHSWQGPLAIFIAVAGVGAGIAIALPAFRKPKTATT